MRKICLPVLFFVVVLISFSCKQKEKANPENENFFPVLSFIKSQVAQVDTSLNALRKITYIDSTKADTVYYRREQFRELASDFLGLPDISTAEYRGEFTEGRLYDESMSRVILTYQPVHPEKQVIQSLQVLIQPNPPNDKVTNIIVDYSFGNRDSSVQKRMLWQVDRSFQVTTIRQLPGQPETTATYKVIWNEEENE